LHRLVKAGTIRRIRRGLFDLPGAHPIIGQTGPNIMAIIRALLEGSYPGAVARVCGGELNLPCDVQQVIGANDAIHLCDNGRTSLIADVPALGPSKL
jgi:hypothetical protein